MRVALLSSLVVLAAVGPVAAAADAGKEPSAPPAAVRLRDRETIVFYGDSITEQNLYTAFLETFLLSRFPGKDLAVFNLGWSGDTASGGAKRFARDVAPVQPSLVFVNFGMNDGGYKAYDEATYRNYLAAQGALADTVKAAGARQVLFTTSPVDDVVRKDQGVYNATLARMADGLGGLASERGLPLIDLLHPMLDVQRRAQAKDPGFTMIPDAVHPNAVGHLVMAYLAMRQIDAPREVGEIVVEGERVRAHGATVAGAVARDGGVQFDLTLPFLPFYVPKEARPALDLVPLQAELNRFRLQVTAAPGDAPLVLSVDGKTAGAFTRAELANGVDLALLDGAPWAAAGRTLWEAAQYRWKEHFEAWRVMGLQKPAWMMPALASFDAHARAQRAYADPRVRNMTWYVWRDEPLGPSNASGWQSGMFFADGRPKPALAAFELPFAASTSRVWGVVRPGAGHSVDIEARTASGAYRRIRTVSTDARGGFSASVKAPSWARYVRAHVADEAASGNLVSRGVHVR